MLATAILDFWRMSTSCDTGCGTIKKFDPENMGIAVGILLLCTLELEICLGVKYPPPAAGKRRQKTAAGIRVNGHPGHYCVYTHKFGTASKNRCLRPSDYKRLMIQ